MATAAYIRRSTADQEDQHQIDSIREWIDEHDLERDEVDMIVEQASGASSDRDQFGELLERIGAGEFDDIVVWEISRIARKGTQAQQFFDAAEESGTTIHVTNGSVRRIEPDGHGRLIADIIAAVAAEERRSLIRRTEAGIKRAREEGKWTGQTPTGFVTVDGYLRPNLSPDYDAGETGYHDMVDALEQLDHGASYRATAAETPNVTRQTLSNIDGDDDRRQWYLSPDDVEDERISDALEQDLAGLKE